MMARLEEKLQEEIKTLEENTVEEAPTLTDHKQIETSEVNETIDVVKMKSDVMENVEAAETESIETNEAGNVMLCCFAALLLHVYYFDL